MYLIADSGATKTEWCLFTKEGKQKSFLSLGLNPNVMPAEQLAAELQEIYARELAGLEINHLWFYGSGVSGTSQRELLRDLFARHLPTAGLSLETDLKAAIRCTGRQTGIVCILGTGSNACQYDSDQLRQQAGGHGYLFGDEGSGADLGRELIRALLQKQLPEAIQHAIETAEGRSLHEIKMQAYRVSRPSAYLAGFAKYYHEFQEEAGIQELLQQRFAAFLQTSLCHFPDHQHLPVDVIGSIGYFFFPAFAKACEDQGIQAGKSWQTPLEGLLPFHLVSLSE
jgi:hypothetical protein